MLPICQNLVACMPDQLDCINKFIANTYEKDMMCTAKLINEYEEGKRPFALVHGDLWAPQVLWRDEETIGGIVDWQMVHRGSPVSQFCFSQTLECMLTFTEKEDDDAIRTSQYA
ncbi:unnamed protein product [Cylicostephanus goldi]|uniref:CHK kinase-like domain-containing protein n=1 Tax=Cylicostephanus goldi TaxID=71465 RepID=A0A3P7MY17_CYLGO|nr:unnamed protein product [Cylicostephanus goldi]